MSLGIAFRAFFGAIFSRTTCERIRAALESTQPASKPSAGVPEGSASTSSPAPSTNRQPSGAIPTPKTSPTAKTSPSRSDALTLLSTLQREARLVDLICEPLEQFSDAQIGAAAREVLKDSRQTLDRLFAITPLAEQVEGEPMTLASGQSAARVRLVGKSQGTLGTVVHRGWQATKCELPEWQGERRDALILTPTEVEVS